MQQNNNTYSQAETPANRKRFAKRCAKVDSVLLGYIKVRYTGWPKKVSHYQESSLDRIKIFTDC